MAEGGVLLLSAKELQGWVVPVIVPTDNDVAFRPLSSLSNHQQKQIEEQIRLSLRIKPPEPEPVRDAIIDVEPFDIEPRFEPILFGTGLEPIREMEADDTSKVGNHNCHYF